MAVERSGRVWIRWRAISGLGLLAWLVVAQGAVAADCPGHPDAIGTSRTLVVDPKEHPRIGAMQYKETLPLHDHEVVLTFDDGPLPRNSNQVLQILADQCVLATFFTIGEQAKANPDGVRKLVAAGHTVGTHTQSHPLGFTRLPIERAQPQIDQGIVSVTAAMADPSGLAPFFRFPGLERSDVAERYLASQGIQVWSADFLADDWRHISSNQVFDLAIKRLEARGRGILLLHDIQARTVAALPRLLHELKVRSYRIVHVVPATADRVATATEPQDWQLHPVSETVPIARWPKVPELEVAADVTLPAPALSDLGALDGELLMNESFAATRRSHGVPLPRQAPWPREIGAIPQNADSALPVPAANLFEIAEKVHAPVEAVPLLARGSDNAPTTAREATPARSLATHTTRSSARRTHGRHIGRSGHQKSRAVAADRSASEREAPDNAKTKPPVRVASLKKR
ncbi:MAG TPA: polysaccharide deacetylase family protein [Bradyrhizobium sp.]|nr:polysaccharide deacetylase family protein [Bradyrhizobium sp.]